MPRGLTVLGMLNINKAYMAGGKFFGWKVRNEFRDTGQVQTIEGLIGHDKELGFLF